MTAEQALYFKIMLILGYTDELYEYIEKVLNEQSAYEDIIINLAFCGSDNKEKLSVLEEYLIQSKEIDYSIFIDLIFTFLQNNYPDNEENLKSFVRMMYDLGILLQEYNENPYSEPGFSMTLFNGYYFDAEEGYIDKDEYMDFLKAFVFERKCNNDFQFYKPVIQQSKIKIYLQSLTNKIKLWKGK
ncbi:MAG: hypothetical protein IJE93_02095 [Clostridia bacterium]|nr:hypothetical protein [Clostridia bacterium]